MLFDCKKKSFYQHNKASNDFTSSLLTLTKHLISPDIVYNSFEISETSRLSGNINDDGAFGQWEAKWTPKQENGRQPRDVFPTCSRTHIHTICPVAAPPPAAPRCHGNGAAAAVTASSFSYWWGRRCYALVCPLGCRPEILMTFPPGSHFPPISLCARHLCMFVTSLGSGMQSICSGPPAVHTQGEQKRSGEIRPRDSHVFLHLRKTSTSFASFTSWSCSSVLSHRPVSDSSGWNVL